MQYAAGPRFHNSDDDNIQETNKIRYVVANNETVQAVENSLFNDDGNANIALQMMEKLKSNVAGKILKVIDAIKFTVDYIAPITNESLNQEYYYFQNHPVPQTYKMHGVMLDKNGNYVNY